MKRFLLFISVLFISTLAIADDITINWGVDNQPYTTTTCEIGGDVVLPSVSKRGYIFRGWTPEHFNRGTWATWADVPTQANLYPEDYVGNRIPTNNDYMVVSDANGYDAEDIMELVVNSTNWGAVTPAIDITVVNSGTTNYVYLSLPESKASAVRIRDTNYYIYRVAGGYAIFNITDQFSVSGTTYTTSDEWRWAYSYRQENTEVKSHVAYEGSWRFIYVGTWATDGKNGWKPDVQISNE